MTDPEASTYQPPPHRLALVGQAVDTVHERITTEDDGPETVNERLSDGGRGPDGQEQTVVERLSDGGPPPEDDDTDGDESSDGKPAAKRSARKATAKR